MAVSTSSSSWIFLFILVSFISIALTDVILSPSGNVTVCPGGSSTLNCTTTVGPLMWTSNSIDRFFNSEQSPVVTLGNLTLRVANVTFDGSTVSVISIATIDNFFSNGLMVECSETTTNNMSTATFVFPVGPPPAPTVTSFTQDWISWNMSDCAVQYVVTIINSSDGSVYLNITTSDTNTTVTLPTGVEYCVTVLGVDSIGRRGPPSQQQCYTSNTSPTSLSPSPSPSPSDPTTKSSASSPTESDLPSGSVGLIAGISVLAVLIVVIVVIVFIAVLVIVLYQRRRGYGELLLSNEQELAQFDVKCVCQMYYQNIGLNHWKVVFVFVFPEDDLESVKMFYQDFEEYGSPFDCCWKSSDPIQVNVTNKPNGWTVITSDYEVDIEGNGEPSKIEMEIKADSDNTTPPDLSVEAKLKVLTEPNIIKFNKEAQNVVECVCQVFYHKIALNHWIARVAFFPKQLLEKVNGLYQDANNCEPFHIKFGSGVIKVSIGDTVILHVAGWEVTISKHYQQVTTAAVEQYTGKGEPPYREMTLRATDSDNSSLIILQPVTLIGVRQPNKIFNIERVLEAPDETPLYTPKPLVVSEGSRCFCQVFYQKLEGINHWKTTLAFYSKKKELNRIREFYQNANLGSNIQDVPATGWVNKTINPIIISVSNGWNVVSKDLEKICCKDVRNYNGVGKPPHCEMTFKADSDVKAPLDLTATIGIDGGVFRDLLSFTVCRVAETPPDIVKGIQDSLDLVKPSDAVSMSDKKALATDQNPQAPHGLEVTVARLDDPNADMTCKPEDTEKKPQSQFPMESENGFYYVNLEEARKK